MQVIVDHFEEEFAIVEIEIGKMAKISRELISSAKEGDVINIEIDIEKTNERKKRINELMDDLFID